MKDNLAKTLGYVLWGLLGLSFIFTVIFYAENFLLNWAYVLLGVSALASIVFPIIVLAQNPKQAKGALISLAGLLVVLGLGYAMASDAVPLSYEKYGVDAGTAKMVGMGIIATYTLLIISVAGIIYFGIMNAIKS